MDTKAAQYWASGLPSRDRSTSSCADLLLCGRMNSIDKKFDVDENKGANNHGSDNTGIIVVGATFALYIGIAIWARAGSTGEFYAAGRGVHPVTNGMATAADWMSAASFISMAGLIAFNGYNNSLFLMGWTGGYVLLALLLAPVPAQVRQVHRARVHRRPLLLADRARRGGHLPDRWRRSPTLSAR
jgi:hypothetical protein